MSKLDNLYQSKPMQKLQELGGKLQANKAFNAISSGMQATMALILAGAVFMIIATVLDLVGVLETTDSLYQWLVTPYNMTMGIMAVPVAFAIGYIYSNNLGMKGAFANGVVTMVLFLLVAAPVQSVTLADGTTTMSVLDTGSLGAAGLFTALILPIIAVKIIYFCQKKNIVIKMPDAVPQFLSDSFSTLIPLVINIVLWHGLNTLSMAVFSTTLPSAIMGILSIPLSALISIPGMFVLVFIDLLLWSFGIHGTAIAYIVIMGPQVAYMSENAALVAAGQEPLFAPIALFAATCCCGGTGNVLPLAFLCQRSKSQQLKAVGKAGIVPAIFNISEPMAFGTPIMYNPIMAIPFILNGLVMVLVLYLGYMINFFKPGYIMIMTALPVFAQEFFASMAWQNLFIPVVAFIVGILIYGPFVRIYDRQLLEQEKEEM